MWKLKSYLFGWDYIWWRNTADHGIARVLVLPDGTINYWRYRSTRVLDEIKEPKQVMWLTCEASKYFK